MCDFAQKLQKFCKILKPHKKVQSYPEKECNLTIDMEIDFFRLSLPGEDCLGLAEK